MGAPGYLIDSCVVLDALYPARKGHASADELFRLLSANNCKCYMPSNAYFEHVVALITHYKRDPAELSMKAADAVVGCKLEVISLTAEYVGTLLNVLIGRKMPDLKSQDLIYFCIAKDRGFTLVTEDRKLRNMARLAGVDAFETEEMLANLKADERAS